MDLAMKDAQQISHSQTAFPRHPYPAPTVRKGIKIDKMSVFAWTTEKTIFSTSCPDQK